MPVFKDQSPPGFDSPTALPRTPEQAAAWQEANRRWWESHPMRYDWRDSFELEEFSKEFYKEVDRRFFSDAREFMPWREKPFDSVIDFPSLPEQDVLEIGVGSGSHAGLLSPVARSYSGIDITEYAVKSTSERLRLFALPGKVLRMDAERMDFSDSSFDLVFSWGVIHHSADTRKALEEIHRVLRPGGRAVIMVYHRSFWFYYLFGGLRGILLGDFWRTLSLHQTLQRSTDGGIARYYSIPEWRALVIDLFQLERIRIFGGKAELLPLPGGKLKNTLLNFVPNRLGAFLSNSCRMGSFLVADMRKPMAF